MICFVPDSRYPNIESEFYDDARSTVNNSRMNVGKNHIQHGNTSVFLHSMAVAYYCDRLSYILGVKVDRKALIRGALLHDYFLYDWHKTHTQKLHGLHHPEAALINAEKDFELSDIEKEIISRHMFPLTLQPPKCRESILVCIVDKFCSLYEVFGRNTYKHLKSKLPSCG